jgi:hypothetical protein
MQGAADSNIPGSPADTPAPEERPRFRPVRGNTETPYDVEVWIEEHNRSMQDNIRATETGVGICFTSPRAATSMQTSADGAVVLDVTPDAAWVSPLDQGAAGLRDAGVVAGSCRTIS